mmetsp:Transcript_3318/g.4906  ORF Transcript_3318/g.4906 Transcript_3318/m.4906 type:complete len:314 (+) Transcript_3318:127-1068(+)|eukprot:CAMPEP_0117426796 /NCGR_PEP_ID=MMETSP0758-20121206/6811_1 /TAXON_ID=63605 /ORGANISM="Percolomonas cosmopolitus, Strain AE-1 (ATCC 50343)" /LENGTH=313 /DNA_ID=CAMNT_0005212125 /DNA_START=58 /DNA_END=999 /DNA_ORIENTATION=+
MDDKELLHQKMLEEKSRILYISNYDGTEPTLRCLFESCGKIASIIVIPDKERAYITFFTKEGAEEGVKQDAKWKINQKPIEVSRHQYYIKYANKTPFSLATTSDENSNESRNIFERGTNKVPSFPPSYASPPQPPFNSQDSTLQTPLQNPFPRSQKPHNAVDKSKSSGQKTNGNNLFHSMSHANNHHPPHHSKYISDSKKSKRPDKPKTRRDQPPLLSENEVNRSVYVRNSRELLLNEDEMKKFFSPAGQVERVIVARWNQDENHPTPESCIKGYGFVIFSTEESALIAVDTIHDQLYNDRKVKVRPARKRGK